MKKQSINRSALSLFALGVIDLIASVLAGWLFGDHAFDTLTLKESGTAIFVITGYVLVAASAYSLLTKQQQDNK